MAIPAKTPEPRGSPGDVSPHAVPAAPADAAIDLDWVTDQLAVGACFPMESTALLARHHSIGCVVDVRAEERDDEAALFREGLRLLHLPTPDREAIDPALLDCGVAWVRARLGEGERVFVHCRFGIGRSALLAACVLLATGWEPLAALLALKRARPRISPSAEQLRGILAWSARLAERSSVSWSPPGFEEFSAIAWRPL